MVKYGEPCQKDSDCKSNICEMTYDSINNPIGRKCVKQSKKWGNMCELNSDCVSNRCELTFTKDGVPDKKRCVVIDGLKKEAEKSIYDDGDMPDSVKMDEQSKKISQEKVLLNPHQKALAFKGRGPIAKFTCTILETIIKLVLDGLKALFDIWKMFFKMMWGLLFGGFSGVVPKVENVRINGQKVASCHTSFYFRYFLTILFPPAGVFMAKGLSGWFQLAVCCLLTLMLYFPGLVYAIIIIRGSIHNEEELCNARLLQEQREREREKKKK